MTQESTTESPIDEIHRIRREISDRFGGDISAIAEDAAQRQAASGRPVWQPKLTKKSMHPSGGSTVSENSENSPAAT